LLVESPPTSPQRQTLCLEAHAQSLVVRFESADATDRLTLELNEKGTLSVTRTPLAGSTLPEVCYTQWTAGPTAGKVTLTIGGTSPRTIVASDLWQLLLAERAAAEEHLLPLLVALRPNWRLAAELDAIESALVAQAGADVLESHRAWGAWLDDLDHADFSRRQNADASLRAAGQPVLAFLRQLDLRELNSERRRRVRAIVADMPDGSPDSADRVADWLVADKRVWLALLARGNLDQRIAASEHLAHLCRRPLPFNPQGTAAERTAQLAELTAKLADY
jgi:hypothetical protein